MTSKNRKKRTGSPILQVLYDRYIGDDPERVAEFEEVVFEADIAHMIYDLRTAAGLSQRELAKRVGTTASVICRLEDADYEGHSLLMLKRIAEALNKRLQIRFVSLRPKSRKTLKSA